MIYKDSKPIIARYHEGKSMTYVYKGLQLVWQAITSCFGSGYWINIYEWKNIDAWKNNL